MPHPRGLKVWRMGSTIKKHQAIIRWVFKERNQVRPIVHHHPLSAPQITGNRPRRQTDGIRVVLQVRLKPILQQRERQRRQYGSFGVLSAIQTPFKSGLPSGVRGAGPGNLPSYFLRRA